MRIVVTGANGYLGGHVTKLLAGHSVFALDSHWRAYTKDGQTENSLPDTELKRLLSNADAVVHLAWYSTAGNGQPALQKYCVESTKKLLTLRGHADGIVFASTLSVYGPSEDTVSEETAPQPNCAYTRAKLEAEQVLSGACILRFGSLMGRGVTRTKVELVVNAFASDGYRTGRIRVWNPHSWKPVIHVNSAAWVVAQALQWRGVYNVASHCCTAAGIASVASEETGAAVETVRGDGTRSCRPDTRKLDAVVHRRHPTIRDAVREFRDYAPTERDRNVPWGGA